MPQTKEAVDHSRAAGVPIIVAINKIDKSDADPDRVKQELVVLKVVPEEWGGDTQFVSVSAKTGVGIDALLDAILLQAEVLELSAPYQLPAVGVVLESKLEKGRGPVADILVQKGTLKKGDFLLCGKEFGRVRAMFNENGKPMKEAGPSTPVEVLGLSAAPDAGDEFIVVADERKAREIALHREEKSRSSKLAAQQATKLEDVFSRMETEEAVDLNVVIKSDVQGSLEALRGALTQLTTDKVRVRVIGGGVGGITETDANLALASNAIIIGFNVRADASARKLIDERGIDLHYYSVIYDAIDDIKKSITGMLEPEYKEQIVGIAEVREVFRSSKFGTIAGCMVIEGHVKRNLPIRVLRDNVVIFEGQLESLRRFKEDASEVKANMECGIGVKNYSDVKVRDQIEVYEKVQIQHP
jgi:translation initiation factor IF-2